MTTVLRQQFMTLGSEQPRIGVAWEPMPSRYLTIDGTPAFQIGYSCGTCGLVLRRQHSVPGETLSVHAVRDRLNAGLDDLDPQVIEAFSAQLPIGEYLVLLLEVAPRLVHPGTADDYFAVGTGEGAVCWRNEEFEYSIEPANTPYYRLGKRAFGSGDELFEFGVPMTNPTGLDHDTVGHYADDDSVHPTAVALGLLDVEGPWFRSIEHWGLFHFLLDGHHKMLAAATADRPLRLLSFVAAAHSLATDEQLLGLSELLLQGNSARSD